LLLLQQEIKFSLDNTDFEFSDALNEYLSKFIKQYNKCNTPEYKVDNIMDYCIK